jgi:23S rRNA (guanosine2251-2'-O)-methyltransferase
VKSETLYGIHPVQEAMRARRRRILHLYFGEGRDRGRRLENLEQAAEADGLTVSRVPLQRLQALAGSTAHQGVAASVEPYPFTSVAELRPRRGGSPFLLLLDGIQDPHNLGAIARTALGAGVDGIILPKDRSAAPTPAVSKASAGAVEHLPVARVTNLVRTLEALKKRGVWIYGLDQGTSQSLFSCDLRGPVALVVGAEGKGLRRLVRERCDGRVAIPQVGPVSSLNASVAAGVALYEAFRQRNRG